MYNKAITGVKENFMEKITIKAYAVKHKLSIFNVMKMVKSGTVKSEVSEENGKEVIYILYDHQSEKEIQEQIVPIEHKKEMQMAEELRQLKKEVHFLRKEVEALKKAISV